MATSACTTSSLRSLPPHGPQSTSRHTGYVVWEIGTRQCNEVMLPLLYTVICYCSFVTVVLQSVTVVSLRYA